MCIISFKVKKLFHCLWGITPTSSGITSVLEGSSLEAVHGMKGNNCFWINQYCQVRKEEQL